MHVRARQYAYAVGQTNLSVVDFVVNSNTFDGNLIPYFGSVLKVKSAAFSIPSLSLAAVQFYWQFGRFWSLAMTFGHPERAFVIIS